MTQFNVYLEINEAGHCMAHLPQLPGCMIRDFNQEKVLAILPDTIREYHRWLQGHGEDVEMPQEPIELNLVIVESGVGPFDPSDKAALFEFDRQPLSLDEMERAFQLAAYSRVDLLALVRPLSPSVRKWQSGTEKMSIDRALRHIGNAEEWYVSRLVAPDTLPKEWENDEEMGLSQFLKMSRDTAVARLRQMTDNERSQVIYPAHFTDHPDEPWTARKAIRRFLEHEREHIGHIQEILTDWRKHLISRLTADRTHLLWQLRGLSEELLSTSSVSGDWTAKDLLIHVAIWDAVHVERINMIKEGRIGNIKSVGDQEAMDSINAEFLAQYQDVPLEQSLAMCLKERGGYMEAFNQLSDLELHRQIKLPWGWRTRIRVWTAWRHQHDATHANEMVQWRSSLSREQKRSIGPKYILPAILRAARKEVLSLVDLIPEHERNTRQVCGVWTLKDLIGHLTDWEMVGVDALRQLTSGQIPEFEEEILDFNEWNNRKAAARKNQSWDDVWDEFHATRQELVQLLAQLPEKDLARTFVAPWRLTETVYSWLLIWPGHEREHAIDLRMALQIPRLPKWLRQLH